MRRLKALFIFALGLLFLAQGVAVAAADFKSPTEQQQTVEMPCHGDMASGDTDKPSCCDTDCPDMASCAFAHVAIPYLPTIVVPRAGHLRDTASVSAAATTSTQSLLRPPIDSHG